MVKPQLHIGIDLHGTLITNDEIVPAEAVQPLLAAFGRLHGIAKLYLCTGNDLGFVQRKIPEEVLSHFDSYVLETGCVVSNKSDEKVLASESQVQDDKEA